MNRVLIFSEEENPSTVGQLSRVFDVYVRNDRRAVCDFLDNCSAAAVLIDGGIIRNGSTVAEIKNHTDCPIIVLCDEIRAAQMYKYGADDVFYGSSGELLLLKVSANVKRYLGIGKNTSGVVSAGNTSVSLLGYECMVNKNVVPMTKKELEILHLLLKNRGVTVTRDRILDDVWGIEYSGDGRTADVHISNLRRKLRKSGSDISIQNFPKIGYRAE